jgi:hypothetical protein
MRGAETGAPAAPSREVTMTIPELQREPATLTELDAEERARARQRLEAKRKFYADVVAYLVVNAFLVIVWAIGDRGSFWPGWVMAGWGALLLLDAARVYLRPPVTEAEIDRELRGRR